MPCWNGFLLASCLALGAGGSPSSPDRVAAARCVVEPCQEPASGSQAASAARPADVSGLFELFARMQGLEVSFVETKHIALLALPLESRGRICFLRPGYLSRVIDAPSRSALTITPERLRMVCADEQKTVDLRQNAELQMFVTSLLRVFLGEHDQLAASYTIVYELDAEDERGWLLTLTPRAKPLTEMLRSLQLKGLGRTVTQIEMHEPNGDRTVTRVTSCDPERVFSAAEKLELFGIEDASEAREKSR